MGAIRLFLALVVALDHLRLFVLMPAGLNISGAYELGMNAGYAVMFFYIISGFLITMVLSEKYESSPAGLASFYAARFIRIFALYWPVILLVICVDSEARNDFLAHPLLDKLTNVLVLGMDWRIGFGAYPDLHWDAAVLGMRQAWTLAAELTFYLIAPFLLRSWIVALASMLISMSVRAYCVQRFGFSSLWTYMFLPSTFVFFVIGHLSYRLSRIWRPLGSCGFATFLFIVPIALQYPDWSEWDSFRFWLATTVFAASLPAVFSWSERSKFFNAMGELSYPVYLIHYIFVMRLAELDKASYIGHTPMALASLFLIIVLLGALAAHHLIERPISFLLKRLAAFSLTQAPATAN